ncbi:MAG: FadR/GntR family transcriptional regulator [Anaerotignaceae bacterium]
MEEKERELLATIQMQDGGSMSDKLVGKIRELILTNKLEAGYTFPNEMVMCKQLNTGRSTLREAYKVLEAYGFIKRSKRGTIVNSKNCYVTSIPISNTIAETDFNDLMDFRITIETATARLAAKNATSEDIAAMKRLLIEMETVCDDMVKFSYYDSAFHLKIGEAAHSKLLSNSIELSSNLFFQGLLITSKIMGAATAEASMAFHYRIFDAIILKDSVAAEKAMMDHLESVGNYIKTHHLNKVDKGICPVEKNIY